MTILEFSFFVWSFLFLWHKAEHYRLTRKVSGKTVTETFSSPANLAKAQREVTECQRFRELGEQLLDVNEKMCALRPVTETAPSAQEKKRSKQSKKRSPAR